MPGADCVSAAVYTSPRGRVVLPEGALVTALTPEAREAAGVAVVRPGKTAGYRAVAGLEVADTGGKERALW